METRVLPEALRVINVGLENFADDLRGGRRDGGCQMDWRPPAGGNARLAGCSPNWTTRDDDEPSEAPSAVA